MNKKILDVPLIKKSIASKHKDFLRYVGDIPVKIAADRQLALARISAKLSQVLQCFKEEGIIDLFDSCSMAEYDASCKGYHLSKKTFEKTIYIWTDGNDIVLKDSSFLIRSGIFTPFKKIFRDIDVDKYDWVKFSEELLDYIHTVIYDRQTAYETALFIEPNA